MKEARYYTLRAGTIAMVVALIGFYLAGVSWAQHNHATPRRAAQPRSVAPQMKQVKPPSGNPSLQAIHAQQLPAVQEAVARAIGHLEAGHSQEALQELRQIQRSLAAIHQALGKQVGPLFLNDRCPIMGAQINLDQVPAELTRVHGQGKVAFCCGGCPTQWDRLTSAEKMVRLKKVAAGPQASQPAMQHQH